MFVLKQIFNKDSDNDDSVITHTYEIDTAVTTEPSIISNFIKRNALNKFVIFSTYQSLPSLIDAITDGGSFDLIISDEAHKTTGINQNNLFTIVHDNMKLPSKKKNIYDCNT